MDPVPTWWEAFGITVDASAVLIERHASGGFQATAARDLKEGEIVARIPRTSCLNETTSSCPEVVLELRATALWGGCCACGSVEGVITCRKCSHDEIEAAAAWREKMLLAFILMYERALGPSSPWATYIASIPLFEPVPLLWPAECRQWLAGSEAATPANRDRDGARAEWCDFVSPLLKRRPDASPRGAPAFSERDYLHARSLVASRTYSMGPPALRSSPAPGSAGVASGQTLVPLADLFNHAASGLHGARLIHDTEGSEWAHKVMEITQPIPRGGEVCICYGDYPGATLLTHYAFTIANNPRDTVSIAIPLLKSAAAASSAASSGAKPRGIDRCAWVKGGAGTGASRFRRWRLASGEAPALGGGPLRGPPTSADGSNGSNAGVWGVIPEELAVLAGALAFKAPASSDGEADEGWMAPSESALQGFLQVLRLRVHAQRKEAGKEGAAGDGEAVDAEASAEEVARGDGGSAAMTLLTREGAQVLRAALDRREDMFRAGASKLASLAEDEARLATLQAAPLAPGGAVGGELGRGEEAIDAGWGGGAGFTLAAAVVRRAGVEASCLRLRVAERLLLSQARREIDTAWPPRGGDGVEAAGGGSATPDRIFPAEAKNAGANAAAWALFD